MKTKRPQKQFVIYRQGDNWYYGPKSLDDTKKRGPFKSWVEAQESRWFESHGLTA